MADTATGLTGLYKDVYGAKTPDSPVKRQMKKLRELNLAKQKKLTKDDLDQLGQNAITAFEKIDEEFAKGKEGNFFIKDLNAEDKDSHYFTALELQVQDEEFTVETEKLFAYLLEEDGKILLDDSEKGKERAEKLSQFVFMMANLKVSEDDSDDPAYSIRNKARLVIEKVVNSIANKRSKFKFDFTQVENLKDLAYGATGNKLGSLNETFTNLKILDKYDPINDNFRLGTQIKNAFKGPFGRVLAGRVHGTVKQLVTKNVDMKKLEDQVEDFDDFRSSYRDLNESIFNSFLVVINKRIEKLEAGNAENQKVAALLKEQVELYQEVFVEDATADEDEKKDALKRLIKTFMEEGADYARGHEIKKTAKKVGDAIKKAVKSEVPQAIAVPLKLLTTELKISAVFDIYRDSSAFVESFKAETTTEKLDAYIDKQVEGSEGKFKFYHNGKEVSLDVKTENIVKGSSAGGKGREQELLLYAAREAAKEEIKFNLITEQIKSNDTFKSSIMGQGFNVRTYDRRNITDDAALDFLESETSKGGISMPILDDIPANTDTSKYNADKWKERLDKAYSSNKKIEVNRHEIAQWKEGLGNDNTEKKDQAIRYAKEMLAQEREVEQLRKVGDYLVSAVSIYDKVIKPNNLASKNSLAGDNSAETTLLKKYENGNAEEKEKIAQSVEDALSHSGNYLLNIGKDSLKDNAKSQFISQLKKSVSNQSKKIEKEYEEKGKLRAKAHDFMQKALKKGKTVINSTIIDLALKSLDPDGDMLPEIMEEYDQEQRQVLSDEWRAKIVNGKRLLNASFPSKITKLVSADATLSGLSPLVNSLFGDDQALATNLPKLQSMIESLTRGNPGSGIPSYKTLEKIFEALPKVDDDPYKVSLVNAKKLRTFAELLQKINSNDKAKDKFSKLKNDFVDQFNSNAYNTIAGLESIHLGACKQNVAELGKIVKKFDDTAKTIDVDKLEEQLTDISDGSDDIYRDAKTPNDNTAAGRLGKFIQFLVNGAYNLFDELSLSKETDGPRFAEATKQFQEKMGQHDKEGVFSNFIFNKLVKLSTGDAQAAEQQIKDAEQAALENSEQY